MRFSPAWPLAGVGIGLAGILVAAFAGWLGPLLICGTDGAAVCMRWPAPAAAATWLAFMGVITALMMLQARDWRRTSVQRRDLVLLGVLVAAALIERTWRMDLAEVGYDEASAASLVAAWRVEGLFPLTGIVSSVGIPNPPGWPYLLATALLWNDSPYAVVALGVLVGLLAIVLVWWVGLRWIGPWGALAAAAFYASGFWAAFLGRSGWQPVFLQVPLILCLDALMVLAIRRWPWALAIACGWLALMVQLHYIALVFAAMVPVAAWPARRVLRPSHVLAALLMIGALLAPFLVYELNPAVRFRDFASLAAGAAGGGAHWDLEAWNLLWTLVSNRGVAGLGGPDSEALQQALGRWVNLGLIGIPLVACGLIAAIARSPRGWRGFMIAAWALTPAVGLAHHTLGLLFHYLYIGLPGMAWAVGSLAEWSAVRAGRPLTSAVCAALGLYAATSAATLWVVLAHVDRTATYPGLARPLGINEAAAGAARELVPPGGEVLIGGPAWEVEILRFALGYSKPARVFDDCGDVPSASRAVYLLNSERSRAVTALTAAGAPLLARVARPDDAFVIYGEARASIPAAPAANCT